MTFMKTFWAALLACIVGGIVMTLMIFLFIAGIAAAFNDPAPEVKANSVLKIDLMNGIQDSPDARPFSVGLTGLAINKTNTMLQVVSAVQKAATDPNIKGILIDLSYNTPVSISNVEELRAAIEEFKEQGKFVVSYGDMYLQGGYYLSSVADLVLMNPAGGLDWRGMSMSVRFYKGLLDKLGVKTEVVRHGTFKSAVERYTMTSMSPENRIQYTALAESIWNTMLEAVSLSRGIDAGVLDNYATDLAVRTAPDAVEYGLVDALVYQDQLDRLLKNMVEGEEPAVALAKLKSGDSGAGEEGTKPATITLSDYIDAGVSFGSRTSKNKVALIYADGDIVDRGGDDNVVGADIAARLAKARKDDKTKAVVLRVNSPGGSALASELIWREMELTRAVKPVIVSMGSMAASGGYYISCPADLVLCDRTTITGSIGVFGIMFDLSNALKDKLGVTVDVVRTNPSADWGSPMRGLNAKEREAVQEMIEEVYDTFVGHVAAGRNMTWDEVDSIGEGRVWDGVTAVEIGLADGYGGLKDAIYLAVDRAGIADDFRIWQVVDPLDPFTELITQLAGGVKAPSVKDELGELFIEYKAVKDLLESQGVQARMPYNLILE